MKRHDPFNTGASAVAVAEPPKPQPQPTPVKKGLKKLSFGAIPEKKEDTKTAYPVYHDAAASVIAARIRTRQDELEALLGALKTDKAELKQTVGLFYFQVNHGKHDVPSSISVPSEAGEVLVCFQNRYGKIESDDALMAVLGERAEKYFRCQDTLTIHCDKIDAARAQQFVDEFQQLAARFGAADAIEVKSEIKPVKDFHTARHTELTVEENMALEDVAPITAMIKTKGRGEK